MTVSEQYAAALAQRLAWRGIHQPHLDALAAHHANRHARTAETVARAASCPCGRFDITPQCETWEAADDHLGTLGWTHLDDRALCPDCSIGGAA